MIKIIKKADDSEQLINNTHYPFLKLFLAVSCSNKSIKLKTKCSATNILLIFGPLAFAMIIASWMQSRAFILGLVTAILFAWFQYNERKVKRIQILIITITIIATGLLLAYTIKSDSTMGRLLIYKISWRIFTDNFLIGVGLGNFKSTYGLYQASYFKLGNYTEKEFLLADNVFFAFNDYWQFIIETGIIGILVIVSCTYLLCKMLKKSLADHKNNRTLLLATSLFIAVCIAALFTHVFEKLLFQLFSITLITWLIVINFKFNANVKKTIPIILPIVFVIYQKFFLLLNYQSYIKFEQAKSLSTTGYVNESRKIYAELYPILKNDASFMRFYLDNLPYGNKNDVLVILKGYLHLISYRTDNRTYMRLAQTYERLNLNCKAESTYLIAINMVPNRFRTRLALFNFYINTKKNIKARIIGSQILKMTVKIPSNEIEIIKKEVREKMKCIPK